MKKTKIKFEDIKAGDLIEVVKAEYGVKNSHTGIVFELEKDFMAPGMDAWKTSEDGILAVSDNDETIYRIDVMPATFDDIQKGDKVRVTDVREHSTLIVEFVAFELVPSGINPFWYSENKGVSVSKYAPSDVTRTIEILERGE